MKKEVVYTLPEEMVSFVKEQVMSGAYATESDVICEGLRNLFVKDESFEKWLHEEVVPAYHDLRSGKDKGTPIEEVRAWLTEKHRKRVEEG